MVKNLPVNAGDVGSIPGLGRAPGEGNGNSLQYSCLANLMDREALWAAVHRVAKESVMTKQLNSKQQCLFYSLIAHFFLMKYYNV